jgi:protein-S-isoprenylcysteine O-methyltransferase Ste14
MVMKRCSLTILVLMAAATGEAGIGRMLAKALFGLLLLFAVLFLSANTLYWPEGWLYVILQSAISGWLIIWLKKHDPVLLRERAALKKPVKGWDAVISIVFAILFLALFVTAGLDAVRYHWTQMSLLPKAIGFAGIILWGYIHFSVLRVNSYVSKIVEVRPDQGQKVVSEGPYRIVRHPMYVGFVILFMSIPLALGSLYALIPGALLVVVLAIRTSLEDRTLQKELPGYSEYTKKTRYKLLPGVW